MTRLAFRKINLKLRSLDREKLVAKVKMKPNESLNLLLQSEIGKEEIPRHSSQGI